MSIPQQLVTIGVIVLGTMLTRFLPFFIFPDNRPTPPFVRYLGCVLPAAVFGMQVVYCLKDIRLFTGSHGLPELIAVFVVIALHLWKRQMLLSIAGGTFVYMFLVQLVFPGLQPCKTMTSPAVGITLLRRAAPFQNTKITAFFSHRSFF